MRTGLLLPSEKHLLRDEFLGSAVNANVWTITDTESRITVSTGALRVSGGLIVPAWGDPRVAKTISFRRRAGLTFECELTKTTGTQDGPVTGWSSAIGSAFAGAGSWYFYTANNVASVVDAGGTTTGLVISVGNGVSVRLRTVLKAAGRLWYVSTDAGLTWQLCWEDSADTTDPLFVMTGTFNAAYSHDYLRVRRTVPRPDIVTDPFARVDSAASLGSAETGQAWSALVGTWGIISNQAYNAGNGANSIVALESGRSNGIVEVKLTTVGTQEQGLAFRVVDSDDLWEFIHNTGSVYLAKWVAGVWTQVGSVVQAINAGDVLRVCLLGTQIRTFVNATAAIATTDSAQQTATQHGLWSDVNDARFDDFRVMGGTP